MFGFRRLFKLIVDLAQHILLLVINFAQHVLLIYTLEYHHNLSFEDDNTGLWQNMVV